MHVSRRRITRLSVLCLLLMLALTACSSAPPRIARSDQAPPTATTVPIKTAAATVIPASSTATLPPTSTINPPTATPTSAPPTATATPTPLLTPTPITVQPTPTLPTLDAARRAEIFDKVWDIVAEHYVYPDFHGHDWMAMKLKYRPRALEAPSSAEFYAAIEAMVEELHDDHSRFADPQAAFEEQVMATGAAYVGIGVVTVPDDDGLLVTTVYANSPAADAGVKRRDKIVAVGGRPINQDEPGITGPAGTDVRLDVVTADGQQRSLTLQRRAVVAQYQPEVYLLPGTRIGYVLIQSFWAQDIAERTNAALHQLLEQQNGQLEGLIIDLRANRGGWRPVLEGLLADFVKGDVGSFSSRQSSYPLTIEPSELYEPLKNLPVVVLVDRETRSYAEVFAAVLQAERRAEVVGVNTAGNTETIYAYNIEDGSRLWVAQEQFKLRDGANLEGRGVIPDRSIAVDWTRYSERHDPHIVKAVQLIRQRVAGAK